MSKAFTKEDDTSEGEDGAAENEDGAQERLLPTGVKNYITTGGAERLKAELKKLLYEERPELVRVVAWAASNGDRSENGDYIYGKRRMREVDRRIRFLTKRLECAEVIDPATQKSDRILFGATVKIEDEEGGERTYSIVGVDEIDPKRGHISWRSPVARALLGARVGDVVSFQSPRALPGESELVELEVLAVKYEAIPA
ncbi:transcription elongation factor GreB [Bdellovibrionota bacterium FG-2]